MYCPFCQAKPQCGKFCTRCGHLLPISSTQQSTKGGRKLLLFFLVFVFAIAIVGFAGLAVTLQKQASQQSSMKDVANIPSKNAQPPKPKTKAEIKREAAQLAKLNEALRIAYAKNVEDRMLAQGINCDVVAIGPKHTILRFKWALVSKVTAYQFAHSDTDMWKEMGKLGFAKFTITDGYDESWYWTLHPDTTIPGE